MLRANMAMNDPCLTCRPSDDKDVVFIGVFVRTMLNYGHVKRDLLTVKQGLLKRYSIFNKLEIVTFAFVDKLK
jgi:hypothetical protein